MAEKEQLRAAMLKQLAEVRLATEVFTASDGGPALRVLDNEQARERAVDALLPLIEHWTRNILLVSEEGFEKILEELKREEDGSDAAAFRTMAAISKVKTVVIPEED